MNDHSHQNKILGFFVWMIFLLPPKFNVLFITKSIRTHKRKRNRSKTNKIISRALRVKRRLVIASEFSDDDEEVLVSTRKVKKCKISWSKFELSNPWPGQEDQAAFDAAAASAVSTNASLQVLEGFDLPLKR
ncbi:MAG: hypothetical protein EZS28_000564 [Streblomastix strix]|uniref:Uncharacterized protein n=1 Tax=Streblomastix strix TaxID=222440 RepID=A0A5J4X9F9_9EUKA|nr:MAG: hypothetical protein EZS28_000564 [Streblomastix strix]